MKKGISIWSFPEGTLAESFALAADAGFEGVEVALDEKAGEITLDSTEKELLAIKNQAKENGIELYSVASGLYWSYFLNDADEAVRTKAQDIVKKQLEIAAILGCDSILVIPGCVNAEFAAPEKVMDYETCYNRSLESIMAVKKYAEEYKVNIGLENVWNKFLLSPMEMRDFIDKIGSDYVLSLFGEPKAISSARNVIGEKNSYVNSLLKYDDFVITVEGTWDLPAAILLRQPSV